MNKVSPTDLTSRVEHALDHPVTDPSTDPLDVHAALAEVLEPVGSSEQDAGGTVRFLGAEPVVPDPLRLASAPAIGLVAKSVALARLSQFRGGPGQDIEMDLRKAPHRLCPFYDRKWELLNGLPQGNPQGQGNPLSLDFYRCGDGRWVMPLNPYPVIRNAALTLLRTYPDRTAVATAIAGWSGADLELAGAEAGVVMPMLRTTREFLRTEQYREVLAQLPLIEIEKIGDSAPEPLSPNPDQPLDGVRALGLAHVIAGGGIGRTLAQHGADALNIWRPNEIEIDQMYCTAQVGVRSATLDYRRDSADRSMLYRLLGDADILYANRRNGYLAETGLSPLEAAQRRPGIVYAYVTLYGDHGPWITRPGFDQTAGCITGMMNLVGADDNPRLPLIGVVNDWLVPWLATTGIVEALIRRATEGGSYRVHICLTRVALWILSLGIFDKEYARAVAGIGPDRAYMDPDTFTAETPCGTYQGVTDQVLMSKSPGKFHTILMPRGSGRPEWLPR